MPKKIVDLEDHFFSKIEKNPETGCWLWQGGLHQCNGYGRFCVNRLPVYAHRWSYEYHKGPIPDGLAIDHLCHVRHCVNPAHLEAVTNELNMKRSKSAISTHCARGHEYTEADTRRCSNGWRKCLECERICHRRRRISIPRQVETHCTHGHPFDESNTKFDKRGYRFCVICKRIRGRKRSQRANTGKNIRVCCRNGHFYKENAYTDKRGKRRCLACKQERISGIKKPDRTHCAYGHPYDEENTYHNPRGHRYCRTCQRIRGKARNEKCKQSRVTKTHCPYGHPYKVCKGGKLYCPECNRISARKRTLKKPRQIIGYTPKEWEQLKQQYDFTCLCCGKQEPEIKLTADHVIPTAKGGNRDISNIQPLCGPCNFKKHTKIIDYRPTYTAARQARFEHGQTPRIGG